MKIMSLGITTKINGIKHELILDDPEMEIIIDKIIKFLNDERYDIRPGREYNSYIEIICDFCDDNKIVKTMKFQKFINGLNLKMDYIYGFQLGLWKHKCDVI